MSERLTDTTLDEVMRAAVACLGKDYDDERWDPMLQGGPLNPERIDEWTVTSSPAGEPICSLSSYGHWPVPGIERVANLAKYIASIPPGIVITALAELRQRRAADLSADEREALRHVQRVYPNATGMHHAEAEAALAVLAKLTGGGE
jgi:hypothetical protein